MMPVFRVCHEFFRIAIFLKKPIAVHLPWCYDDVAQNGMVLPKDKILWGTVSVITVRMAFSKGGGKSRKLILSANIGGVVCLDSNGYGSIWAISGICL